MNSFLRTGEFDSWLSGLKDNIGKARIVHRLRAAELGNFGDCEPVGEGISEMRVHFGPGNRVYFTRRGDKTTQKRDIKCAKQLLKTLDKETP
jgi:putative addiction module killer protein